MYIVEKQWRDAVFNDWIPLPSMADLIYILFL